MTADLGSSSSARWAPVVATGLSVVALLGCFIMAPMIYSEVQSIWLELDTEMDEFKVCNIFAGSHITSVILDAFRLPQTTYGAT